MNFVQDLLMQKIHSEVDTNVDDCLNGIECINYKNSTNNVYKHFLLKKIAHISTKQGIN